MVAKEKRHFNFNCILFTFFMQLNLIKTIQKNPRFRRLHSCLGRVTRFELANAWFTARCVRPLHHTRQMLNYNNLFTMSLSKCFYKTKSPTRLGSHLRETFRSIRIR